MKKLLSFLLLFISAVSYSQIIKSGGLLYSNGNPNTRGLDTLTLKNLNRNSEVAVDISNGSLHVFNRAGSMYVPVKTSLFETLTLPQFQSSVVYKTLVPGTVYKITGVHKNKPGFYIEKLYDDGNDLGITIYLTALSNSTFTNSGYGEFYNPKYQFASNYYNTDTTGLWGIWDTTNTTYAIGNRVIWGGYMWENVNGNQGTSIDDFTLDSEWTKIPYSDTSAYKKVIDYIEYDYDNDFITRRIDELANIDVNYKLRGNNNANWAEGNVHPIAAMQYGNYVMSPSGESALGSCNNSVIYSYFNCINFKTLENSGNYLINSSTIKNISTGKETFFLNNVLKSYSIIASVNLPENSLILGNDLNNSYIAFITAANFLQVSGNTLINSSFNFTTSGTLSNKVIQNNNLINANCISNMSNATHIYGNYSKNIFKRADGTIRLSYYNNSDTLQVVNVTD